MNLHGDREKMLEKLKIFDYLKEIVYLTDVETNEIIYLNNTAMGYIGGSADDKLVGQKCYKAIHNLDEPCPFCNNSDLKKDSLIEWEHYNTVLDKTFLLRDSIFSYNGRDYRVEIGTDVADIEACVEKKIRNFRLHEGVINDGLKMALAPNDPDEGIQNLLSYIGELSQSERIYIFEDRDDVSDNTYEWCAEGVSSEKDNLQNVPAEVLDIWRKSFRVKQHIIINDIEDIKESDPEMYATLKPQGIHSIVVCPIYVDENLIGFCGFDNPPDFAIENCSVFLMILSQYLGILISKRNFIREKSYGELYDYLTGLYNREYFFKKTNILLKQSPETPKWMILINIKDFKLINNIYGSEFGDKVLKDQAEIIKKYTRNNAISSRIFGDKFVLLLQKEHYDMNVFYTALGEFEKMLKTDYYTPCHHVIACNITGTTLDAETLYNCLNIGEKDIKNKHEFSFVECDYCEIERNYLRDAEVLAQFHKALLYDEFEIYIQAHVNNRQRVVGGEALVRWDHPIKGLVFPNDFIPLLESSGLIYKLDVCMWHMAAEKLSEWKKMGCSDWHISVNVSADDLYTVDVCEMFIGLIRKYDIEPKNLILEITESTVIENLSVVRGIINTLKEYGFKIAVDDFGKGYSSLNMIVELPFDIIKFDKAFLDKSGVNEDRNRMLLKKLVDLVKYLGAEVVFEGVETEEQYKLLRNIGVDLFQGYYFAKPMPAEQFNEKFIK